MPLIMRAATLFLSCLFVAPALADEAAPPRVEDGRIVDGQGRVLLLRGLNTGNACKYAPYLPWQADADWDRLRPWGMNAVRLLIAWKAVEPRPGEIDEAYLDEVARRVRALSNRGVYVLLDMHQDVYGEKVGGNGAPDWAVLGTAVVKVPSWVGAGMPWFVGYVKPEVLSAFDAFWDDAAVPATGRGVQEHYADAWKAVARRFRGEPYVLGYDLMNEPFYGTAIFAVLAAAMVRDPVVAAEEGLALLTGKGTGGPESSLHDVDRLDRFLAGMEAPVKRFERRKLMPFYDRVARAVREVDHEHIVFLEGTALKFAGGRSFLRRPLGAEGKPLANVAFAQHYYDPTMANGSLAYDGRRGRVERALAHSLDEARAEGAALLLGEYGTLGAEVPGAARYLADYSDVLTERGVGSTYWAWERDLEGMPFFAAFARPYAAAVAGRGVECRYEEKEKRLVVSFMSTGGETEVYLPEAIYPTWRVTTSDAEGTYETRFDAATMTLTYRTSTNGSVRLEVTPAR